jgi:hypothetical protein
LCSMPDCDVTWEEALYRMAQWLLATDLTM